MSGADVRGFRYALEPVLRRARWRLEASQLELAACRQELDQATASQGAREQAYGAAAEDSARALAGRFDLARHQRSLAWLARLRGEILHGAEGVMRLRERAVALRAVCLRMQARIDVLERHRDDAVAAYRDEAARRHGAAMDGDWLARRHWHAGEAAIDEERT